MMAFHEPWFSSFVLVLELEHENEHEEEDDSYGFMVPMRGILTVVPSHEPG